jgi:hypothetical protein
VAESGEDIVVMGLASKMEGNGWARIVCLAIIS